MNRNEFILVSDNDGHYYVIPAIMEFDWDLFIQMDPDDPKSWNVPSWADEIGGSPTRVRFKEYRIKYDDAK